MSQFIRDLNNALALVVGDVRQSVVQILTDEGGIGAGTVWHSDGLIVTNAHVVLDRRAGVRRKLSVQLASGQTFPAKILAYDIQRDLAALNIEADHLPTSRIGDSHTVKAGDWVMSLGHPWGITDSLTAGIVIGAGNHLPEQEGREWIALSLKLRPGHSGGPLFDTEGRLIGINTMISGPEVGFAIPIHIVKEFLKEAMENLTSAQAASHQPQKNPASVIV